MVNSLKSWIWRGSCGEKLDFHVMCTVHKLTSNVITIWISEIKVIVHITYHLAWLMGSLNVNVCVCVVKVRWMYKNIKASCIWWPIYGALLLLSQNICALVRNFFHSLSENLWFNEMVCVCVDGIVLLCRTLIVTDTITPIKLCYHNNNNSNCATIYIQ